MKTVTIPKSENPWFVCVINDVRYKYPSGATVEVPDEVADLIAQINASIPQESGKNAAVVPSPSIADEGKAPIINENGEYELAPLARVDGYYDEMTVGMAEQLNSNTKIVDQSPYNFRTAGGAAEIWNKKQMSLVGGTVAVNQLIPSTPQFTPNYSKNGVNVTASGNGVITITGTYTGGGDIMYPSTQSIATIPNHIYYVCGSATHYNASFYSGLVAINTGTGKVSKATGATATLYFNTANLNEGDTLNETIKPQLIDLTQMFGSTIADYAYTLEQAQAGSGINWLKSYGFFTKPYYAYNAGELMSVQTGEHTLTGFNQFDPSTGKADIIGGQQYQITGAYTSLSLDGETITPDAGGYFTPTKSGVLTVTGGNATDTCVHLVWDGERDGEYEAYAKHSYPLSPIVLRGIPKLDASNNLYYDGDTYEADGTVTRTWAEVALGDLTWVYDSSLSVFYSTGIVDSAKTPTSNTSPYICSKYTSYPSSSRSTLSANAPDKTIMITSSGAQKNIAIKDSAYSDATAFKSAMNGVKLVYELATSTTESADPYPDKIAVDNWGTEAFVDYAVEQGDREVAVPVGNVSKYDMNLRDKLVVAPDSPDVDGDYLMHRENGVNSYTLLSANSTIQGILAKLPTAPSENGAYKLTVTVTSEGATYSWESEA